MVFSIIGMLCFIVAIVGFMVVIKRRQDKNDEKSAENDCEKIQEKKWNAMILTKMLKHYSYLEFYAYFRSFPLWIIFMITHELQIVIPETDQNMPSNLKWITENE